MIKGDYFGKLLKPVFSILLIGFFGLLGSSFVNATSFQAFEIGNWKTISNWNTQYEVGILPRGRLLSSYLGYSKEMIALDNQMFVFWSNRGLYAYVNTSSAGLVQGYFQYMKSCDEITLYGTGDSWLENCTAQQKFDLDSQEIIGNFINTLKTDDMVYIEDNLYHNGCGGYCTYYTYHLDVCFSSSEIGKTLCFVGVKSTYPDYYNPAPFTGGWNLPNTVNFTNIDSSILRQPPLYWGSGSGGGNGSQLIVPDNTYTGDYTYTECTYGDIYNQLNNMGYNPYLCYGGLDNYDNMVLTGIYNAQPGTGVMMRNIFTHTSSGQTRQQWFNYWNTSYINQYVSSRDIWYNQPASLYFLFKFYNEYGGSSLDFNSVWEYCNIEWLMNNISTAPTSKYTGDNFQYVCSMIRAKDIMNGIGGNDGENIEGLNWEGVGVLSGNKSYDDPGQFITDMFTKIKSYIPTDTSSIGLGFLPTYIITFMLFLMLFRFLSH